MTAERMVSTAKGRGFTAIALCDHGTIAGFYSFLATCKKHSIKPVLGCEIYYNNQLKKSKDNHDRSNSHMSVFARNKNGYMNIVKLTSQGWTDGFYYKPRVDESMLIKYSKDLVVTTACMGGMLKSEIYNNDFEGAIRKIKELKEIYGNDSVFVEVQINEMDENRAYVEKLIKLKNKYPDEVRLILGQDSHYANRADWLTHEVMLNIQASRSMKSPDRRTYPTKMAYIKNETEQWRFFKEFNYSSFMTDEHFQEAIDNTHTLVDMVEEFDIALDPVFVDVEKFGFTGSLKEHVISGIKKRGYITRLNKDDRDVYFDRIKYELKIIKNAGIEPYFLATKAIVDIAKENDVLVGPGRGSAAGSLVNYLIGTTNIDPIKHGLLFERFINPERVEMPDIDIDYSHIDKVNTKLKERFGERNVTRLATYSFYQWKGLVRDLARVFEYDIGETTRLAGAVGMIGNADKWPLDILRRKCSELDIWCDKHAKDNVEFHINNLHGLIRHKGVHAAGLMITTEPVQNFFPVERHRSIIVSAYTDGQKQRDLGDLGGVKFDVLGLKTLRMQQSCIKMIAKRRKKDWKEMMSLIDFSRMDENDSAVYDNIFIKGDTKDIFQFESPTARRILKQVRAENFADITAVNALNRPGPLKGQYDKMYADSKKKGTFNKIHPVVDEILKDTYGTLVYQEQIVRLCKELGDLTNSEAELVRKGIFKLRSTHIQEDEDKQKAILNKIEKKMFENGEKKGLPKEQIKKLWKDINAFVAYSFNKAHAASYAAVAYVSAWLKYHYPIEWYCAYLNGIAGNAEKLRDYIQYLNAMNVTVHAPHVNAAFVSQYSTIIDDSNIRLGTNILKNVGTDLFKLFSGDHAFTYFDFVGFFIAAINDQNSNVNKRVMEALIKVGFFDDFPVLDDIKMDRSRLLYLYKDMNDNRGKFKINNKQPHAEDVKASMLEFCRDAIAEALKQDVEDFSNYQAEVEIMNFSLQEHPYIQYKDQVKEIKEKVNDDKISFMGEVVNVKDKMTKNNRPYRVVTVQDVFGSQSYKLMFWEYLIAQHNPITGEGGIFIIFPPDPTYGTCKLSSYTNIPM